MNILNNKNLVHWKIKLVSTVNGLHLEAYEVDRELTGWDCWPSELKEFFVVDKSYTHKKSHRARLLKSVTKQDINNEGFKLNTWLDCSFNVADLRGECLNGWECTSDPVFTFQSDSQDYQDREEPPETSIYIEKVNDELVYISEVFDSDTYCATVDRCLCENKHARDMLIKFAMGAEGVTLEKIDSVIGDLLNS